MALRNEDLVAILCEMINARVASDRLIEVSREQRVGAIDPIDGREAAVVGASWSLDPACDWIVPELVESLGLGRYGPEVRRRSIALAMGHPLGGHLPAPTRVLPPQPEPGAQVAHAVGLAWSMVLRNEPGVVLVFLGERSCSRSDVDEALQLAEAVRAPMIAVCTITGAGRSPASASKMPTVRVDGADPLAVIGAVADARERTLNEGGPALIEALVEPAGTAAAVDPLVAFRRELEDRGIWDRAMQIDAERGAQREFDEARLWASNLSLRRSDLIDNVFQTPTARLAFQRAAVEAEYGAGR